MGTPPVFKEVNTLPGSEAKRPRVDWNRKAGIRKDCAHVGRGVICALQCVPVPGLVLRRHSLHENFQVNPGGGVVTLADNQGCAGVLNI